MAKSEKKQTGKRADGLYQVSVIVEENGKQKRKYFYGHTKQEAKEKMMAWSAEKEKGRTFREVAEDWQKEHWLDISDGTKSCYAPLLQRAIDYFSGVRVREIDPLDVKAALDKMKQEDYAKHTAAIFLCVLNQVFNYAIIHKDITINPAQAISIPSGMRSTPRECPSDEQLEIVRKSVTLPFGLFAYMLMYTGLRRGELLALQWRDIDLSRKTLSVTKSASYAETGNRPKIKEPKTDAGVRTIVLLDRLVKILFPLRGKPDEYVFGGAEPLTQTMYRHRWRNYCLESGLYDWKQVERKDGHKKVIVLVKEPNVTPHQFRHAFATMCKESGVSTKDAQHLLGHSKYEVTMNTYTHIREKQQKEVAALLNKAE